MGLHILIKRQMERVEIDEQSLPNNLKNWQSFLGYVSNAYEEADQERYLVERSIEVSSNEFLKLTEKLETAQDIAHLGYWSYDPVADQFVLSENLYRLFDWNSGNHITNKEQLLEYVHEEDRNKFENLMTKLLAMKKRTEEEIRIANGVNTYQWFHFVGGTGDSQTQGGQSLFGTAMNITQRKKMEQELVDSNQQLISTARLAGMADVATSVLHNVGNTLNSANVAVGVLQEILNKPTYQKFSSITGLLQKNEADLPNYLANDPKGKLIPQYLKVLHDVMDKEHQTITQEVGNIARSIQHIREIIAAQQSVSKVVSIAEKVCIPEVIEDAFRISSGKAAILGIKITKNYENVDYIETNKSKIIQILVNLIQNAQESFDGSQINDQKAVDVSVQKDPNNLHIIVADNGCGIPDENLQKLFTFGFTTKPKGHGFGLHSSIIAAREIGGNLKANSQGIGKGTTFTLTLPLTSAQRKQEK